MAKQFEDRQPNPTEDGGRRVVASTFVTLDGYMVGPGEDMSWVTAGFDQEMQADIAEDMSRKSDVFVFGRVTYEIFAAYWPHAIPYEAGDALNPAEGKEDPQIIRALNDFPKLVFSKTLKRSEWSNTLFSAGSARQDLELTEVKPYANGVVAMRYKRKGRTN